MTKSVSERELVLAILMEITEEGKYSQPCFKGCACEISVFG